MAEVHSGGTTPDDTITFGEAVRVSSSISRACYNKPFSDFLEGCAFILQRPREILKVYHQKRPDKYGAVL